MIDIKSPYTAPQLELLGNLSEQAKGIGAATDADGEVFNS